MQQEMRRDFEMDDGEENYGDEDNGGPVVNGADDESDDEV